MTSTGQAGRPAGIAGRLAGVIMARLNADMEHAGVELLGLRGDERALEIGYGPGAGISALLAALPGGRVVIALRTGGRPGHAGLAARYADFLVEHDLVVTRHPRTMRTGPAVFVCGQRHWLAA